MRVLFTDEQGHSYSAGDVHSAGGGHRGRMVQKQVGEFQDQSQDSSRGMSTVCLSVCLAV